MKNNKPTRWGCWIALATFITTTILLISFYFSTSPNVLLFGYMYGGTMIVVNLVASLFILFYKKYGSKDKMIQIGCQMLNIPISVLYMCIVLLLVNNIRLTLSNTTDQDITQIRLEGCKNLEVGTLRAKSDTVIWFDIPTDCNLSATYRIGEKEYYTSIFPYLTTSMGGRTTFKIPTPQTGKCMELHKGKSGNFSYSYIFLDGTLNEDINIEANSYSGKSLLFNISYNNNLLAKKAIIDKADFKRIIDERELNDCYIWSIELKQIESEYIQFLINVRNPKTGIHYHVVMHINSTGDFAFFEDSEEF